MKGEYSVVIVGAGIAGAATAFFLAQKGVRPVMILERDRTAGNRSTGRNAAILRTLIPDPALRRLARESAAFYREPPEEFCAHSLIDQVGIYLAATGDRAGELRSCLGEGEEHAPQQVDPGQLYSRIPLLAPDLGYVLHQPDEGVIDVHSALEFFLRGARRRGAELRTACEARRLVVRDGRVAGLETSGGLLRAGRVLLATGGWAAELAAEAGCPLTLTPYRRHLLVTEPLAQVNPRWPVVWILGDDFYFRPEGGGLLMCGCDTVPVAPQQGEVTDPVEVERIAAKAARWLPALAHAGVARSWAGMRTFAEDQRFVIGPDPRLPGLYWAAALGGHGITCAPAVGKMAAQWVAEGESDHPDSSAVSPRRLLT